MQEMLEDTDFEKEYPVVAYLKHMMKNRTKEQEDKQHENLVELFTNCGFDKLLALLGKILDVFKFYLAHF